MTLGNWYWILGFLSLLFVFVIGTAAAALVVVYAIDRTQRRHAIRRNYPVIGRLRPLFEHLGRFFRPYFFAMDREELPFNRTQRLSVYRAAKNQDTTSSFGSTSDANAPGRVLFVNSAFPALAGAAPAPPPLVIGPDCPQPYAAPSLFNISGMSFGAISRPAIQALAAGARDAGCWLNTGEGGLADEHRDAGCDLVFQIGTARYGVRDADGNLDPTHLRDIAAIPWVRMFEIKLSQGAKPGKGGLLPGCKITAEIARIRGIPQGQDSISPNRHPEAVDCASLLDLIARVRGITGKPTGIKFVLGDPDWMDALCREIVRRGPGSAPDFITIDGAEGGTGAAPGALLDSVGLPLAESLPSVVDTLAMHGLREHVRVIASGRLITPSDITWALCVGADFVVSARGFMFALGCIQAMQCNRNTCPTGITTHDPRRQMGLDPTRKAVRVAHYVRNTVSEIEMIARSCGVNDPRQLERRHARIVVAHGRSLPLNAYYARASIATRDLSDPSHESRANPTAAHVADFVSDATPPSSPAPGAHPANVP